MTNIVALVKLYCLFIPEAVVCIHKKKNKQNFCMHIYFVCILNLHATKVLGSNWLLQAQLKWLFFNCHLASWWMANPRLCLIFSDVERKSLELLFECSNIIWQRCEDEENKKQEKWENFPFAWKFDDFHLPEIFRRFDKWLRMRALELLPPKVIQSDLVIIKLSCRRQVNCNALP